MSITNAQREAAWAAWEAEQRAAGLLPPAKKRKPSGKRPPAGGRNPWASVYHAFVDEQETLGPDRKLSSAAFRVWVHLHRHADGRADMSVRVGIGQLARAVGASDGHVRRAIKELIDRGYLIRTVRGRKSLGTSRYVIRGGGR